MTNQQRKGPTPPQTELTESLKENKFNETTSSPTGEKKPSLDLEQIVQEAMETNVETVAPNLKKGTVTDEQATKIVGYMAEKFEISQSQAAIAIMLLFLKGASSERAPLTLSTEVCAKTISKRDLLDTYKFVTGNSFLRRLAETMAEPIGKFAERNGLQGELAQRIGNQLRAETGESLTAKEQAWCSSFSQGLPNLKDHASERLCKLLAEDYCKRFTTNKAKPKNISKNPKQAIKGSKKEKGNINPKK